MKTAGVYELLGQPSYIRCVFNFLIHNNRELAERLRQWTCKMVSLPC